MADGTKENARHEDWLMAFIFIGVLGGLGDFIAWLVTELLQLTNRTDYHLGILWIVLAVALSFFVIVGSLLVRDYMRTYTLSMDFIHVFPVYPEGYYEGALGEEDDDEHLKAAEDIDYGFLNEKRWHGIKKYIPANATAEQIRKIMGKQYRAEDVKAIYENRMAEMKEAETRPIVEGDPEIPKKGEERPLTSLVDKGPIPRQTSIVPVTSIMDVKLTGKESPWRLWFDIIDNPMVYFIENARDKRIRGKQRQKQKKHFHSVVAVMYPKDILMAMHLRRMMIPQGGFSIRHSHADDPEVWIYDTVFPGAEKNEQIPLYWCVHAGGINTSAELPRIIHDGVEKGTPDVEERAACIIDGITTQAARFAKKLEGDVATLKNKDADRKEDENVRAANAVDGILNDDAYERKVNAERNKTRLRMAPTKAELPIFWTLIVAIPILAVFLGYFLGYSVHVCP